MQAQILRQKFFNQFYLMNGLSKMRKGSFRPSDPIFDRKSIDEIHATGFDEQPSMSRKELMMEGLAPKERKKKSGDQES